MPSTPTATLTRPGISRSSTKSSRSSSKTVSITCRASLACSWPVFSMAHSGMHYCAAWIYNSLCHFILCAGGKSKSFLCSRFCIIILRPKSFSLFYVTLQVDPLGRLFLVIEIRVAGSQDKWLFFIFLPSSLSSLISIICSLFKTLSSSTSWIRFKLSHAIWRYLH